jgi:hypothetical protein
MTLPALESVRRFAMHVVPGRLVRIRQYGLLANRGRGARLAQCRRLLPSVAPSAGAPSRQRDYRWLIIMTMLLATATQAELAQWSRSAGAVTSAVRSGTPQRHGHRRVSAVIWPKEGPFGRQFVRKMLADPSPMAVNSTGAGSIPRRENWPAVQSTSSER